MNFFIRYFNRKKGHSSIDISLLEKVHISFTPQVLFGHLVTIINCSLCSWVRPFRNCESQSWVLFSPTLILCSHSFFLCQNSRVMAENSGTNGNDAVALNVNHETPTYAFKPSRESGFRVSIPFMQKVSTPHLLPSTNICLSFEPIWKKIHAHSHRQLCCN